MTNDRHCYTSNYTVICTYADGESQIALAAEQAIPMSDTRTLLCAIRQDPPLERVACDCSQ